MIKSNKDIFESVVFDLPKKRSGSDLVLFLKNEYSEFLSQISLFRGDLKNAIKVNLPLIENQIELVINALNDYYKGFPSIAFEHLSNALNILEAEGLLPIQKIPISTDGNTFFRIRVSDNRSLTKNELFHIPFQFREKVSTQRYSIPGLPCLYLGDSIFVCWEELGRPDFDKIHVSRFDLSTSGYKFLHFTVTANDIRKRCFPKGNTDGKFLSQMTTFLSYWPIYMACSIIVDKPTDFFKPEYTIPQLLLQWVVSTKKLDGIKYKSNRVNPGKHNFGTFSNIVIPIKNSIDFGICNTLKNDIKLTNPVSWQLLDIATLGKEEDQSKNRDLTASELRRAMYIELINGEKTYYNSTKFGILEGKLKLMSVDKIR